MKVRGFRDTILIERMIATAPNAYGSIAQSWQVQGTLRAQVILDGWAGTAAGSAGVRIKRTVVFKTRAFGGVSARDRVTWLGEVFTVVSVAASDVQAGNGLEITCEGLS